MRCALVILGILIYEALEGSINGHPSKNSIVWIAMIFFLMDMYELLWKGGKP